MSSSTVSDIITTPSASAIKSRGDDCLAWNFWSALERLSAVLSPNFKDNRMLPALNEIDASRRVRLFFFALVMSSPPRVDFPTSDLDDVDMDGPPQEGSAEQQSMSIVPQKLFLEGTPSAAGTPARQQYAASAAASSPLAVVAARRAVGMSTPRRPPRTPLFARTCRIIH